MLPPPSDSNASSEARHHINAAKRLAEAQLTEPGWADDPFVAAAIAEHCARAMRWLDVAAWTQQHELAA